MKILLVYPPFCSTVSPPYSLTNLHQFLKCNAKEHITQIKVVDLNAQFHSLKFPQYKQFFQNKQEWNTYDKTARQYNEETRVTYAKNNKLIRANQSPEFTSQLIETIKKENPDIIAFSVIYSSQVFYTLALLKQLTQFTTVVGGPAVTPKLKEHATHAFNNEVEFLAFITKKPVDHNSLLTSYSLDFSIYNKKDYFTPQLVLPLKTSTTCFYKQCTFCAHYAKVPYQEYSLQTIEKTIIQSKQKYFFLIDDMIPVKRLQELAEIFAKHNIKWGCQLRPTKDHTKQILQSLYDKGLRFVLWGVESGNQRILDLIKKGTNTHDIENVLKYSHFAGIKNILYIMFGFPTETKEEFEDTITFLKTNSQYIDLISTSNFGLHEATPVYNNPQLYSIKSIVKEQRSILEPKIIHTCANGLTQEELHLLRKQHQHTINKINKIPRHMNFFREHVLFLE